MNFFCWNLYSFDLHDEVEKEIYLEVENLNMVIADNNWITEIIIENCVMFQALDISVKK